MCACMPAHAWMARYIGLMGSLPSNTASSCSVSCLGGTTCSSTCTSGCRLGWAKSCCACMPQGGIHHETHRYGVAWHACGCSILPACRPACMHACGASPGPRRRTWSQTPRRARPNGAAPAAVCMHTCMPDRPPHDGLSYDGKDCPHARMLARSTAGQCVLRATLRCGGAALLCALAALLLGQARGARGVERPQAPNQTTRHACR